MPLLSGVLVAGKTLKGGGAAWPALCAGGFSRDFAEVFPFSGWEALGLWSRRRRSVGTCTAGPTRSVGAFRAAAVDKR